MELSIDLDLLTSSDDEFVTSRMKDSSSKYWQRAASVAQCRPVNSKVELIPQSYHFKSHMENERRVNFFDFGMKLPALVAEEEFSHILDLKKQEYGAILKSNSDNQKLEQELLIADPSRKFDQAVYIVPTVASVFGDHEVLAYFQLRNIKIRDLRNILIRQFNFFRSIERRLTLDVLIM